MWFFLLLLGIMFQDITTLLLDTKAFKDTIDLFVERYRDQNISVVAGILPHSPISNLSMILCLVDLYEFMLACKL